MKRGIVLVLALVTSLVVRSGGGEGDAPWPRGYPCDTLEGYARWRVGPDIGASFGG